MDRRRSEAQLALRPVEFHILLSLATGERHGYGVIKDIERRGETSVPDVGTMYRALARMVENGLIATAALNTEWNLPFPFALDGSCMRGAYMCGTCTGRVVESRQSRVQGRQFPVDC